MAIDLILPISMTLGIVSWALLLRWYVHPALAGQDFADTVRPLLLLHAFRYIGLMFLIPGVTADALDPRFAAPAAYGDLLAALLALAAIAALQIDPRAGIVAVWIFNVWGLADLVNAVARGLLYTPDGALGATFWIPAFIVPLLIVTHVYLFAVLLRERRTGSRRSALADA